VLVGWALVPGLVFAGAAAWYWDLDLAANVRGLAGCVVGVGVLHYLAVGVLFGWRGTVVIALLFGVGFHIGIGVSMELGPFVPYMLCIYLPLLPAERLTDWLGRRRPKSLPNESASIAIT
jgi:hypothetical protein